jgi:hypothetical protein
MYVTVSAALCRVAVAVEARPPGAVVCERTFEQRRKSMAKTPENNGKAWTPQDVRQLKQLARENTPTRVIALKMERTPGAVQNEASRENISLKPTNQSPYNRQKK